MTRMTMTTMTNNEVDIEPSLGPLASAPSSAPPPPPPEQPQQQKQRQRQRQPQEILERPQPQPQQHKLHKHKLHNVNVHQKSSTQDPADTAETDAHSDLSLLTLLTTVQELVCVDAAGRTGVYTGTMDTVTKLPHTLARVHVSADSATADSATDDSATDSDSNSIGVMLYTINDSPGTVPGVCKYSGSWCQGQWHGVCSPSMVIGSSAAAAAAAESASASASASAITKDGIHQDPGVSDDHANGESDNNDTTAAAAHTTAADASTPPIHDKNPNHPTQQHTNILLWQSGDVYQGDFYKGQRHGTGTFTWADGRCYTGDFSNNRRDGVGRYTWPDTGAYYQGGFQNNQRHGQGSFQDPVQDIEYTGSWKDGVYHGYGTYHWTNPNHPNPNKQQYVYAGNFRQGLPDGMGREVVKADGTVRHFGLWKAGKPVLEETIGDKAVFVVNDKKDGHVMENSGSDSNAPRTTDFNTDTNNAAASAAAAETRLPPPPLSDTAETTVVQNRVWNDPLQKTAALYRGVWDVRAGHPTGNGTAIYTDPLHPIASYEGCFVNTNDSANSTGTGSSANDDSAGLYDGHGRMVWRNGDVYTGAFVRGQRHGHGLYTWRDGRQYTGQFKANIRHGVGTYMFANLDLYEGEFVNGQRQGEGRFVFSDGSVYQGDWMAGLYHGQGTSVQTDGKTFEGGFREGQAHGFGKETDAAGKVVYEGEWIRGVRADQVDALAEEEAKEKQEQDNDNDNGDDFDVDVNIAYSRDSGSASLDATPASKLTATTPVATRAKARAAVVTPDTADRGEDCEAVVDQPIADVHGNQGNYTGIVAKSTRKPHGTGRLVYADGQRIHEGFWTQGSKEGFGRCLFFPQGDFHEGEYRNNLRHGPGRYQWKDGRYFEGDYKDDLRDGKGLFTYPSGERYEGMFERGQRRGFGRFDFDDGKGYYEGEWAASTYNGKGRLVWSDGSVYEGELKNGVVHGQGVRKNPSGEIAEEGTWIEGKLQEPQVMTALEPPSSELLPPLEATGDDGTDIPTYPATLVEQQPERSTSWLK